jgi:hypothetical protein
VVFGVDQAGAAKVIILSLNCEGVIKVVENQVLTEALSSFSAKGIFSTRGDTDKEWSILAVKGVEMLV